MTPLRWSRPKAGTTLLIWAATLTGAAALVMFGVSLGGWLWG